MCCLTLRKIVLTIAFSGALATLTNAAEPANKPPAPANEVGSGGLQEEGQWSQAVNGLQARIVIKQGSMFNGTLILAPYLELKNVSNMGNPMKFPWGNARMTYRVFDAEKHALPSVAMPYDGFDFGKPALLLPPTATLSFDLSSHGAGIPADQAGLIDLGADLQFLFKHDARDYFFQLVMDMPGEYRVNADGTWDWNGKIELPPAKVPLNLPKLDPKAVQKVIDEWGPKLLSNNGNESAEAQRHLAFIDDNRVIPWYVKAVATDNYDLKFSALDRLGRLNGNEALAGLKIGMITRGKDIDNCSTPEVAEQCAVNIRVTAAHALARSPLPDAKPLLISMADDPDKSVRLTAMQQSAAMNTPEGWTVVRKATADTDAMVRDEATRLLKEHEQIPKQP